MLGSEASQEGSAPAEGQASEMRTRAARGQKLCRGCAVMAGPVSPPLGPCPHPSGHSGSPGHGDEGSASSAPAGLSAHPRDGIDRSAHLPPRLRSSPSALSAEGHRDGWMWQSTACGPRPPQVDMPPPQEDPRAQPHTPPAVVSAPQPRQQPFNPDTSRSVPNEMLPAFILSASGLGNTWTAHRGLFLLC